MLVDFQGPCQVCVWVKGCATDLEWGLEGLYDELADFICYVDLVVGLVENDYLTDGNV